MSRVNHFDKKIKGIFQDTFYIDSENYFYTSVEIPKDSAKSLISSSLLIFSSIAGFISTSYHGQMLFVEGATVGIGSLIGVYFGIKVKDMVKATSYKNYVLLLNVIVLIIMLYKTL